MNKFSEFVVASWLAWVFNTTHNTVLE